MKKEKEFLGQKNDELQKRINSLDKKNKRNKSVSARTNNNNSISRTPSKSLSKKFKNLSILKNKGFTINNNNNKNNSKSLSKNKNNKKFTPKRTKFLKISIANKVVNICIKKKKEWLQIKKSKKKLINLNNWSMQVE